MDYSANSLRQKARQSGHNTESTTRTDGQRDHGFVGVWRELHPVHDGPDGVECVVGHLGGLHVPPQPAALAFGGIQTAVSTEAVNATPSDSRPIWGFAVDRVFSMDSISVHLYQVSLVVHPRTSKDERRFDHKNVPFFPPNFYKCL